MKILGIDPGLADTGYGVVSSRPGALNALDSGVVKTSADDGMPRRLEVLYDGIRELLLRHRPDEAVLEQLFFNTNQKTALLVGQACGVIVLACAHTMVPCREYTPLQVKMSVVGNGNASKKQVQFMVSSLLKLGEAPLSMHASDALAVAICHVHNSRIERAMGRGAGRGGY